MTLYNWNAGKDVSMYAT